LLEKVNKNFTLKNKPINLINEGHSSETKQKNLYENNLIISAWYDKGGGKLVVVVTAAEDQLWEKDVAELPHVIMRRMVVGENEEFRAGFSKALPGRTMVERPLYVDEFFVGIKGHGRLTCRSPPDYDKEEVYELKPGTVIFMSKGTIRRLWEVIEAPLIYFYCAIPSSSKGTRYKIFPSPTYESR